MGIFVVRAVAAAALQALASSCNAAHGYIQKVRCAVACFIFAKQEATICQGPDPKTFIYKIAFDETEMEMDDDGEVGTKSLMMIHA